MAPAFSKEAILTGEVDHICLVCERYMRTEQDITTHITQPAHRKNLEETSYVEKFKGDRIRKIKKWYFCEFCNILLSTLTKVSLHVEESKHNDNKSSRKIERSGDFVILLESVAINEESWHGLIDNTCILCNLEFDDAITHKNESTHIINLIKSKVSYADDNIYRKIDDFTFHCLTCNTVVAEIIAHIGETTHKELLQKCRKEIPYKNEVDSKENISTGSVSAEYSIDNENKDTNIGNVTRSDHVNTTNIPCDTNNDIIKPSDESKIECDVKFDQHICKALEANDYIHSDQDGKCWCILCDWHVDPLEVKIHLDSAHHQTILKMHNKRGEELNNSSKAAKIANDNKNAASDILDSIEKFQKNNITIDFECHKAVCKTCSKNIEFNSELIENHIQEHKNNILKKKTSGTTPFVLENTESNKPKDNQTLFTSPVFLKSPQGDKENEAIKLEESNDDCDEAIQKLAERHDLTYNSSCKKIYCPKCNKHIPSSIKNINEHVLGEPHKNKAQSSSSTKKSKISNEISRKINTNKQELKKVLTIQFIDKFTVVENVIFQDVILNEKYCINLLSFSFLTNMNNMFRCHVCEISLPGSLYDHIREEKHERVVRETPVIIHIDTEFIREVRPGLFHCGYCNIIEVSWEGIENHLKLTSHKETKTFAQWRLMQYLPDIRRHNAQVKRDLLRDLHNMVFSR